VLLFTPVWEEHIVRVIKIKKIEMGGAYSMYRGRERCVQGFGAET
jgi:hypothetical protein